jgi:HDOD domain
MNAIAPDLAPDLAPSHPIDLQLLQARVRELPALPQAVLDVLAVLRSENSGTDDCAEHIARDQSMTARTLKLANSAFYGVPGRVATVRDAVHLLGRRTLGSLLTSAAVSASVGSSGAAPGFTFAHFWRASWDMTRTWPSPPACCTTSASWRWRRISRPRSAPSSPTPAPPTSPRGRPSGPCWGWTTRWSAR